MAKTETVRTVALAGAAMLLVVSAYSCAFEEMPEPMTSSRPVWDEVLAGDLVGKTVLIGLTRRSTAGDRLEQLYGVVEHVDAEVGIILRLQGSRTGETYNLPPDLRPYLKAPAGDYRLRGSGEVVTNPDYTTTWTVEAE